MRLAGKVALITGAAARPGKLMGFGGASAHAFLREGAKVVITDVLDERGEEAASEIRADGGEVRYRHLDVTSESAIQYAEENIRVNSVHPGFAVTPMTVEKFSEPDVRDELLAKTPLGRLGTAEDIANGIVFLASDESAFMTGSELVIDGGMTAQ